jgi:tRNA A-37 threonylcarbamoyl transferase component Bud32
MITEAESKVIGEGGYGCVLRPTLKCKAETENPVKEKNLVTKKYSDLISKAVLKENMDDETKGHNLFNTVDPLYKYHLPYYTCLPDVSGTEHSANNLKSFDECSIFKRKNIKIEETDLIVQGYAGVNLSAFAEGIVKTTELSAIEKTNKMIVFWKESIILMLALLDLRKKGVIHHDIKPQNILFNPTNNKFNIIDFGFTTEDADFKSFGAFYTWPIENYAYNSKELFEELVSTNNFKFKSNTRNGTFFNNEHNKQPRPKNNPIGELIANISPSNTTQTQTYGFFDYTAYIELFKTNFYENDAFSYTKNQLEKMEELKRLNEIRKKNNQDYKELEKIFGILGNAQTHINTGKTELKKEYFSNNQNLCQKLIDGKYVDKTYDELEQTYVKYMPQKREIENFFEKIRKLKQLELQMKNQKKTKKEQFETFQSGIRETFDSYSMGMSLVSVLVSTCDLLAEYPEFIKQMHSLLFSLMHPNLLKRKRADFELFGDYKNILLSFLPKKIPKSEKQSGDFGPFFLDVLFNFSGKHNSFKKSPYPPFSLIPPTNPKNIPPLHQSPNSPKDQQNPDYPPIPPPNKISNNQHTTKSKKTPSLHQSPNISNDQQNPDNPPIPPIDESKVIGEGGFGCVFRPNLVCNGEPERGNVNDVKKKYNNLISKAISKTEHADETKGHELFNWVDPKYEYHLPFYTCSPNISEDKYGEKNKKSFEKCLILKEKNIKIEETDLIVFGHAGLNLMDFVTEINGSTVLSAEEKTNKMIEFWKESFILMRALLKLKEKGVIHHDIKPQNILFDQNNNKFNIIDFGLTTTYADFKWGGAFYSCPIENYAYNSKELFDKLTEITDFNFSLQSMNGTLFNNGENGRPKTSRMSPIETLFSEIYPKYYDKFYIKTYGFLDQDSYFLLFDKNFYRNNALIPKLEMDKIKELNAIINKISNILLLLNRAKIYIEDIAGLEQSNDSLIIKNKFKRFFFSQNSNICQKNNGTDKNLEEILNDIEKYSLEKNKFEKKLNYILTKNEQYEIFQTEIKNTFDSYGMGMSLIYVLVNTCDLLVEHPEFIKQMYVLLFSLMHPNLIERRRVDGKLIGDYIKLVNLLPIPPPQKNTNKQNQQNKKTIKKTITPQKNIKPPTPPSQKNIKPPTPPPTSPSKKNRKPPTPPPHKGGKKQKRRTKKKTVMDV